MKITVINGSNINMLGIREPDIYGRETYDDLCNMIKEHAAQRGIEIEIYQSNHEGDLVDKIQSCYRNTDGIVINPGAYTHTSIAILDALKAVGIPYAEVHISKVNEREEYRRISYIREYAEITVAGEGLKGYITAMDYLIEKFNGDNK